MSRAAWADAYRPLRPRSLGVQLVLLIVVEVGLFSTYGAHDARFHWATHFLIAVSVSSVIFLVTLLLTGAPGPRYLLAVVLGIHLIAMAPDLLFRAGIPHQPWMDVFLGHVTAHRLPGGDTGWLLIAVVSSSAYIVAITLWLRARTTEARHGLPPGVGLTGGALLRPQRDPRVVPLAYEEYGPADSVGRPVVLLHGLGASSAFWRPVALVLARDGARTFSPDLLGFGGSLRIGTHFHLDDQAAAVIRFIETTVRGSVIIAAHSFGAAVAVAVALDRPDLVSRLALVAPAAFDDADEARRRIGGKSWLARKTMNGSPVADLACGLMCLLRVPLTALAPRISRITAPNVSADVARGAVNYVWPAYRDAIRSLLSDRFLVDWLRNPGLPTSVTLGRQDRTVPIELVLGLTDSDIDIEVLPGSHFLPLEIPDQVAAVIGAAWRAELSTGP